MTHKNDLLGLIKYRVWVKWVIVFCLFNKVYKSGIGSARMLQASDLKRGVQMTHMTHKVQLSRPRLFSSLENAKSFMGHWGHSKLYDPNDPKACLFVSRACLFVAGLLTYRK
jgi:hypothetical protein